MSRTLVLTETAAACGRIVAALRMAEAFDGGDTVVATLSTVPDPLGRWLHACGIPLVRIGESGARSVDAAVEGTIRQWEPSRVICFSAPRAIPALRWVRALPNAPSVEFLCARADTLTWPETEITAIRGHNVFDAFHVEDEASSDMLMHLRVGRDRIVDNTVRINTQSTPAIIDSRPYVVVHGGSWERRVDAARDHAARLRATGHRAGAASLQRLLEVAVVPSPALAPGCCEFVESSLDSLAAPAELARRGWWVSVGVPRPLERSA